MRTTSLFKRWLAGWPAAGAAVLVCCLGSALVWQLTDGLHSFTSEAWRREAVQRSPRLLPNIALEDEQGQRLHLHDLCNPQANPGHRSAIVLDFVYTRCPTVCRTLGAASTQLANRLSDRGAQVHVLSISFDPEHDTPEQMLRYKRGMESTPSAWHIARASSAIETEAISRTAGVVVIADGLGGFEHNAALVLVDSACKMTQIFDVEEIDHAERAVRQLL